MKIKNKQIKDITGQKFGRLTAIEYAGRKGRRTMWLCKCDCGNEKIVNATHLRNGHTVSCGCKLKEINQSVGKICYKNGLSGTRISRIYWNMINRCYYEKFRTFKHYGGRGIKVCNEWLPSNNGYLNFCNWSMANGYNDNLTIDRIDNNGNYEPRNCRWVDRITQSNNKRNTIKLKINGNIDTIANLCRQYNVSYSNLWQYAHGSKNHKYPELKIEIINE